MLKAFYIKDYCQVINLKFFRIRVNMPNEVEIR